MTSGKWTGTMNLTEPHCGTDLGLSRTKAVPQGDGSYKITGTKIFISSGEHDMAENIIHLVLARLEGAPAGIKGLSLFVVPKFFVEADGSVGKRNGVMCGSIEHKMGIHGNSTCVLNYDDAIGWLIGEENRGINAMFTMMNEARLGVAVQGLAISEAAYQNAAIYARDRLQGRSISGVKAPDKAADPIIVHPDVRRMLMTIRALNEASRALVLWTALKADVANRSDDEKARQAADDHMGLLTPGAQRRADRQRPLEHRDGAADLRRARLHRRARHGAVRARCAHHDDLRGRERHPGARSGRAQARPRRRARDHGVLQGGLRLREGAFGRRGDEAVCRAARRGARHAAAGDDVVHSRTR
jgi:alkylation response protein AidB-like acyl-CoA dehydrogenase